MELNGSLGVKWKSGIGMKEVQLLIGNYSQRHRLLVKGVRMTQGDQIQSVTKSGRGVLIFFPIFLCSIECLFKNSLLFLPSFRFLGLGSKTIKSQRVRYKEEEIIEKLTCLLGNKLCSGIDARVILERPIHIDL